MVTIVPSFNYEGSFPLLSNTRRATVGPFDAGMPANVPLWVAKALYRRNFAQIELPEWLSVPVLTSILREERESTLLSRRLPFHYFEIARALDCCLLDSKNPAGRATKVVLQDLVAVRSDKLRMHFHELSRSDLVHPPAGYDDVDEDGNYLGDGGTNNKNGRPAELPIISVTGICSYELNKVGPFLQRAFSDYGFLTRRPSMEQPESSASNTPNETGEKTSKAKNKMGADGEDREGDEGNYDSNEHAGGSDAKSRRVSVARSRLRRFRN
eukprot:CAMPEP_0201222898 /NCGR_PEP_ID=MMETSP0851-20130426/192844_1 /ASSEMBLY_ACC=CAM_ASM_000631 /TAXON_ID=183588 /ORGANISM="Pseudo-nitzschia fraudulenta, Strain WWA7" /LENGTH=268 /DNA_ID=CAMNT_0047512657 /DNA_START=198 /DNA_END=1004 /DNA_ORIENTATION=-